MCAVAFVWLIPLVLLVFASVCVYGLSTLCVDKLGFSEDIFVQKMDWGRKPSTVYGIMIAVLFLVLCFLAMMWYGYFKAKTIYPPKQVIEPDSENSTVIYHTPMDRTTIYSFLFMPVLWYLFCTAIMNVFDLSPAENILGMLIQVLVALCPYGVLVWDSLSLDTIFTDSTHIVLLLNLLYYAFIILSFAAGERLYVRKTNETHYIAIC